MGDLEWWQFLGGILAVVFGAAWLLPKILGHSESPRGSAPHPAPTHLLASQGQFHRMPGRALKGRL